VLAGDRIVAVDEVSTVDWKFNEVTTALKGTPGTTVQATFEREGVTEPITVSLTRAIIHTPSVPYALMLDGDIGYVPLQTFNETATAEVRDALARLERQGARGLVLDLRGNGGGIMDQAVTLANLFLPAGLPVATVRYRAAAPESLVTAERPLDPGLPLVVLVDGASASATEIVAGALQDHDRAAIVGTTTFGKGLVQSIFRLQGGHLLKLTTGRWYTPSGRSIHKPRKLVGGRLVDSLPDSLETEAVKRDRPVYRSTGGRVVYGGGAVTPDLIVRPDTLVAVERRILAAIAPKSQAVYLQLYDFASKRKAGLRQDFTVTDAWRDDLYARLGEAGVTLPRAAYDSAQGFVDELIANHVARVAFGDSAARRRDLPRDVQLTRALELLEGKRTQAEVFEKVVAAK
jgi:carboxyl-terminal processing protease